MRGGCVCVCMFACRTNSVWSEYHVEVRAEADGVVGVTHEIAHSHTYNRVGTSEGEEGGRGEGGARRD